MKDGEETGGTLHFCCIREVTLCLFSPVWFLLHCDLLVHTHEGVLNLAGKTQRQSIMFCKSCWLSLICIQNYCLCNESGGLSSGETFQCPK